VSPFAVASTCPFVAALEPSVSELSRLRRFPTVEEIDAIVAPRAGVRFVASPPRPRRRRRSTEPVDPSRMYDGRITLEGVVPTRPGSAHDLWNALVWAAFPRAKRALHARQHRLVSSRVQATSTTLPGARTREQDTIAMVDEGGALLFTSREHLSEVAAALASRAPDALRAAWPSFSGIVFGHAIYEELARGPSRVLAFAVVCETSSPDAPLPLAAADATLAGMLADPERFLSPEGHRGVLVDPTSFPAPRVLLPS
jgi:hypothetical protein